MKHKTLIFTTSKTHWFKKDFADIQRVQEQSKGVVIEGYDVKTISIRELPTEKGSDGKVRPSWIWFKHNLTAKAQGYSHVILHISKAERKAFGISENLGGTYQADSDNIIEFWMCADKGDRAKYYKGKSEFWRIFLHESAHGSERFLIGKDSQLVHHYDYVLHDIHGLYKLFDWTKWGSLYNKLTGLTAVRDALSRGELLPAVKRLAENLVKECEIMGFPLRITSGFRSCEAQNALYAQGRTKGGSIVTNAKCGESLHNYGVAFDVAFDSKTPYVGPWDKVGAIGKRLGLEWGGEWTGFVDRPHFQLMFEYTLKDFQKGNVDYQKYS